MFSCMASQDFSSIVLWRNNFNFNNNSYIMVTCTRKRLAGLNQIKICSKQRSWHHDWISVLLLKSRCSQPKSIKHTSCMKVSFVLSLRQARVGICLACSKYSTYGHAPSDLPRVFYFIEKLFRHAASQWWNKVPDDVFSSSKFSGCCPCSYCIFIFYVYVFV